MFNQNIFQTEIDLYKRLTHDVSVDEMFLVPKTVPQNLFESFKGVATCQRFFPSKNADEPDLREDPARDRLSLEFISDLVSVRQEMSQELMDVKSYLLFFDRKVQKVEQYLRMWYHFVAVLQGDRVGRYWSEIPTFLWTSAFDKPDRTVKFHRSDCLLYETLMVAVTLSVLYFNQGVYLQTLFQKELFKQEPLTEDKLLRRSHACFCSAFAVFRDVYVHTRRQFVKITECFPVGKVPYEITKGFQEFYTWTLLAKMQEVLLGFDRVYLEDRMTGPRTPHGYKLTKDKYPPPKRLYFRARRYFFLHGCWLNSYRELAKGNPMGEGYTEWTSVSKIKKDLALYKAYEHLLAWYSTEAKVDVLNESVAKNLHKFQRKTDLWPFYQRVLANRIISSVNRVHRPDDQKFVSLKQLVFDYKTEYMDFDAIVREKEASCSGYDEDCVQKLVEQANDEDFFSDLHDGRLRKITPQKSCFYNPKLTPYRFVPAFEIGRFATFRAIIIEKSADKSGKKKVVRTDYVVKMQ